MCMRRLGTFFLHDGYTRLSSVRHPRRRGVHQLRNFVIIGPAALRYSLEMILCEDVGVAFPDTRLVETGIECVRRCHRSLSDVSIKARICQIA